MPPALPNRFSRRLLLHRAHANSRTQRSRRQQQNEVVRTKIKPGQTASKENKKKLDVNPPCPRATAAPQRRREANRNNFPDHERTHSPRQRGAQHRPCFPQRRHGAIFTRIRPGPKPEAGKDSGAKKYQARQPKRQHQPGEQRPAAHRTCARETAASIPATANTIPQKRKTEFQAASSRTPTRSKLRFRKKAQSAPCRSRTVTAESPPVPPAPQMSSVRIDAQHSRTARKKTVCDSRNRTRHRPIEIFRQKKNQDRRRSIDQDQSDPDAGSCLPENRHHGRIGRISPRQLHVAGDFVRRDPLQHQLSDVSKLPLVAFQRHIAQPHSHEGKKHHYHQQRAQAPIRRPIFSGPLKLAGCPRPSCGFYHESSLASPITDSRTKEIHCTGMPLPTSPNVETAPEADSRPRLSAERSSTISAHSSLRSL